MIVWELAFDCDDKSNLLLITTGVIDGDNKSN
jgi:hypothetical protein